MKTSEEKIINGVDVKKVEAAVEALKENPGLAKFRFRARNRWIDGGQNRTSVGNFFGLEQENQHLFTYGLDADEPLALAGKDSAPNPVEYLLHALAACVTSTLVYHAALRGIRIDELESELEGDIDLRGLLGISNDVRQGYENIRVNFKVRTDAGNIEKLKALSRLSPVLDVTSHGTKVDIAIERMAEEKAA